MTDELKDVARIGAQPVHPYYREASGNPADPRYYKPAEKSEGMTLRQYAAIAAMQGLLADGRAAQHAEEMAHDEDCLQPGESVQSLMAEWSVAYADALLKELNRE